MNDEQIEQFAYKHSCDDDEPLFSFSRRDLFAFANDLLSASIADEHVEKYQAEQARASISDTAGAKQIITETLGFDFEPDELQTVNADDLLRLASALAATQAPISSGHLLTLWQLARTIGATDWIKKAKESLFAAPPAPSVADAAGASEQPARAKLCTGSHIMCEGREYCLGHPSCSDLAKESGND